MKSKYLPKLSFYVANAMAVLRRKKIAKIPVLGAPYRQRFFGDPLHVCFGCSHTNPKSLKLEFFEADVGGLGLKWQPHDGLESFPNIVHGGLSATILDELGGVAVMKELNAFALTVNSRISYHSPAYKDRTIYGHARIVGTFKRYVLVDAELYDERGKILSSMTGLYYIPSRSQFMHISKIKAMSPEVESYVAK